MQNQSEEKNSESITIPNLAENIGPGMVLSNETWQQIINASQGFIVFISTDYSILFINDALASFLGTTPEKMIGKNCSEILHSSVKIDQDTPLFRVTGINSFKPGIVDDPTFGKVTLNLVPIRNTEGNLTGVLHFIDPLLENRTKEVKPEVSDNAVSSLVNAMPNPTLICDSDGRIEVASASFMELTGIENQLVLKGSNFVTFLVHDEIEKALIKFNSVKRGEQLKATGQFMIRRSRRDSILAEVAISRLDDTGLKSPGILMTFSDISGQMEMIESANKNQVRLSRFNNTFLDFTSDTDANIVSLMTLLGEMLGASSCSYQRLENDQISPQLSWQSPFLNDFSPDAVLPFLLENVKDSKDDFLVLSKPQLASILKTNPSLQEKYGVKTLLGIAVKTNERISGIISIVFTFHYLLDRDDKEFCMMVTSAIGNETGRISNTRMTDVNDENYRQLFDFFTDSIFILDQEAAFLDVNTGACKMFGFEKEEMLGNNPEMILDKDKMDPVLIYDSIKKAFNGEPLKLEWWSKKKNNEIFPVEVILNKGTYFGKEVVIATSRDITERKKAEDKLQNTNLELKEQNHSKDKFFSILAHDLKNPFGGLLGFIDLLYEDIDELSTDQVKEYLQNIRTASYHTYSLLENLLEWSRIQTGKVQFRPSKFDIKEEIESILQVLETNALRKNIRMVNKVESGIIAEADRNMIYSVIQNLTTNAIKFSNSNSDVVIEGKYVSAEFGRLAGTETDASGKWYEISVTDTGIGIPEDIMPKLFKLDGQFSMAGTANEPGTGLGLILCKEMVEKNGGHIRVESFQEEGSTFAFTLPLAEGS